jgi:hydrogenase maturation protein HypF
MAVAWAHHSLGGAAALAVGEQLDGRAADVLTVVEAPSTVATTSMGRLFDAVAAVLGLRSRVSYEGQAAIELEAVAGPVTLGESRPYPVEHRWEGGQLVMDAAPLFAAVLAARSGGTEPSVVSASFHEGVGRATVEAVDVLAEERRIRTVALTGGVFQNARLTELVASGLRSRGFEVLLHRHIPPNDGGISIGQAAIAAHRPHVPGA